MKLHNLFHNVLSLFLILAFIITAAGFAWDQASAQEPANEGYDPDTGNLIFVGSSGEGQPVDVPGFTAAGIASSDNARMIVRAYADRLGIDNTDHLAEMRETTSEARHYYRFQQLTENGVPVFGGEILVNTNQFGELLSLSSNVARGMAGFNSKPQIGSDQARRTALRFTAEKYGQDAKALTISNAELWVFAERIFLSESTRKPELVWKMIVDGTKSNLPVREMVMINAMTGTVSFNYAMIHNALDLAVYDMEHATSGLPGTLLCDETDLPSCTSGADVDADNALAFGEDVYNFYMSEHGRDSINNAGMQLIQSVNYGSGYQNAFWNGYQMVYGDGMVVDDVVGHELTHGVTEYESGLFYVYQSGAINESFSDVWGELIDQVNGAGDDSLTAKWYMGEDIAFDFGGPDPYPGSIRYMANPTIFGDPDRMLSANYYSGTGDSGGVHINSGVNNKAVYLMTDGDTFNGYTITGLGITKVADLYYEAQTNLLIRSATYKHLYYALKQACINLAYSAADCAEVDDALLAVEMDKKPSSSSARPVATPAYCPSGLSAATPVFSDKFDSGLGKWARGVAAGPQAWGTIAGGVTSMSGKSLRARNYSYTSKSYIATASYIKIPSNAYLFFEHAYNIETGWDGGWIEYQIKGATTWAPMNSLIVAGQKETVKLSNGKYTFSGTSKGPTGTLIKLLSLSGKYVKFRFYMLSDSLYGYDGWFIDNFRVHRCQ
jgi:Zn-dependent metalloprotease